MGYKQLMQFACLTQSVIERMCFLVIIVRLIGKIKGVWLRLAELPLWSNYSLAFFHFVSFDKLYPPAAFFPHTALKHEILMLTDKIVGHFNWHNRAITNLSVPAKDVFAYTLQFQHSYDPLGRSSFVLGSLASSFV